MIKDFLQSLNAYVKAAYYLIRFRLYKYLFLLLILLGLFVFPVFIFDYLIQLITGLIPYAGVQKYALVPVNIAAGISGFILLLVLSPLFSMVSEEVGQKLHGKTYRFSPAQLLKDIIRGVKISLRNLFYQYLIITLISIALYFLPENTLLQSFGNVLIILTTAYFYGFSILDYAMENYRMSYKASVTFVRNHPGIAIGLGSVYYLMISLNNLLENRLISQHTAIYWSAFSEAVVAFLAVIAASYLLFKKIEQPKAAL